MTSTNGALTPPHPAQAPSSPSSLKRKRSETASQANGAASNIKVEESTDIGDRLPSLLSDIYGVLKSYDTKPSILDHNLNGVKERLSSGEPSSKRNKKTEDDGVATIAHKLRNATYPSVEALMDDVEKASADLLASVKSSEPQANGTPIRYVPPSLAETRLVTGLLAFKKVLRNIILREVNRQSTLKMAEKGSGGEEKETKPSLNATPKTSVSLDDETAEGKTVLTLFANASGPRVLFSSLQQPTRVAHPSSTELDATVDVTLPIQEAILPNIISATKVVPVDTGDKTDKKKPPTIGDLFAPPPTIPQLSPPKPAKSLTTRGSSVGWVQPESAAKPARNGFVYSKQGLTTGQWLGYGGIDSSKEPVTAEAKQKHRQRALSTGEANPPVSEATIAALNQAKEDALFRSVYSSFAPTHDDAIAIVPSETKDQVWWHKVGAKKFVETFAIDPALLGEEEGTASQDSKIDEEAEAKAFDEAVATFDPEEMSNPFETESKAEKETNEILQEISELLETLHSYQRIRNSSLTASSRTPVAQNASLAQLNGTPSSPSAGELETYNILKSQLALMIQMLPPYAVAKLDGDQLADLNISRNIVIETKNYRGVMEEDHITRLSKANALNTAAGSPAVARTPGPHQSYGAVNTQYARATPAHPASTRAPMYYQQGAVRSPSIQYGQGRNPASMYQTPGGYGPSTPRPGFAGQAGYNQQAPRPGFAQQPPNASYHQPQRPPQSYGMPSTYYPQTPQTAPQNRAFQGMPPQTYTQPRPNSGVPNYGYGYNNAAQSPHGRTVSPMKPGQGQAQPMPGAHSHAQYQQPPPPGGYTTPMVGQAPRPGSGHLPPGTPSGYNFAGRAPSASYVGAAHPSAYASQGSQAPQPGTPGIASAVGPSGFHTSMTNAEQQSMLDRQRAALNMTPGSMPTRTGTPGTPVSNAQAMRQGSGTPQPIQGHGQYNGAPMAT